MNHMISNISQLQELQRDYVLVTLVDIEGSAPQVVGSKMIVDKGGLHSGTVGGGKIEAHSINCALELLSDPTSKSVMHTWNLQTDIKMTCGGVVSMFFEPTFFSAWTIAIFGAGHISQELCRVLSSWNCRILVFDTRKNWFDKLPQSNNIEAKLVCDMADEVQRLPENCYLISMTQGHQTDLPILKAAFERNSRFAFIGVIGSDLKAKKVKNELIESGLDKKMIDRLASPVGLAIGNNTPPEIAISISAQLLAVRDGLKVNIETNEEI